MQVELHPVGCGECTALLGEDGSLLLVDCGSLDFLTPRGVRFKDYVTQSLTARYSGVTHRAFLLSHYHRDHACGLWDILREKPGYFDELFLPCTPCDGRGLPLLLEFALFAHVFLPRQGYCGQVSTGALRGYERCAGQGEVYTLGQGDRFVGAGQVFVCLWPPRTGFAFSPGFTAGVERLHQALEQPDPYAATLRRLHDLFYDFCTIYIETPLRAAAVLREVDALAERAAQSPAADTLRELLTNRRLRELYCDQTNAASLIFHSEEAENALLMTGDATPEAVAAVQPLLYENYAMMKAPHHGTWCGGALPAAEQVLVCGCAERGSVWGTEPGLKHCTAPCAAPLPACNRAAWCPVWGGLALHCPGNRGGAAPCGVRVMGQGGCVCSQSPGETAFW